jgi:hypothetical protein
MSQLRSIDKTAPVCDRIAFSRGKPEIRDTACDKPRVQYTGPVALHVANNDGRRACRLRRISHTWTCARTRLFLYCADLVGVALISARNGFAPSRLYPERCSHGLVAWPRLYAVLTSAICENACGKLPSKRRASISYSSASKPTSLHKPTSRPNRSLCVHCPSGHDIRVGERRSEMLKAASRARCSASITSPYTSSWS